MVDGCRVSCCRVGVESPAVPLPLFNCRCNVFVVPNLNTLILLHNIFLIEEQKEREIIKFSRNVHHRFPAWFWLIFSPIATSTLCLFSCAVDPSRYVHRTAIRLNMKWVAEKSADNQALVKFGKMIYEIKLSISVP